MQKTILAVLVCAALAGCATPTFTYDGMQAKTQARSADLVQAIVAQPSRPAGVREIDAPYVDFKRVDAVKKRGDVSLKASGTAFAPLMAEVARRAGYSVVFADNVDATKKVTAEFNQSTAEDVLRNMAFLAGYAAVIDRERRIVTVADTATYTYKLPAGLFSTLQATYNVGGNAASSGSGSTPPGVTGGGGSTLQAQFNITGKEGSAATSVQKLINDIAGGNAQVTVSEMGFLSVRANAQSLRRVTEFLKKVSNDAMTQVDIEASVVEVSLEKEFSLGIQWGKVLQSASNPGLGINGGSITDASSVTGALQNTTGAVNALIGAAANPGVGAFRLGASTASIISALASFSDVKIVSQPRLFSMNNTPATFFDGTQIPYLGKVEQTASTASGGAPTVSGTASFAIDGISFSVIPSVIDKDRVQITVIPVLSTVGAFEKFPLGAGTALTVPHQASKQTYMRVLAESGKTLVIGGIRSGLDTKDTSIAAKTGSRSVAKEVVILLRATVVPAPEYDPVVAESI